MFLEKRSRFIRQYQFNLYGRKTRAPAIPMVADVGEYSAMDAIKRLYVAGQAHAKAANGDTIEIIDIKNDPKTETLTLLFHRASPDAAEPDYRKKANGKVTVRTAKKEAGEEQSVSCHLVIRTKCNAQGFYDVFLEEIPRLSITLMQQILARALNEYVYEFTDEKNRKHETYTVLKSTGVKSESVSDALKGGYLGYITLSKPADAPFVDGKDFVAVSERMRIRIEKKIEGKSWTKKIGDLAKGARNKGWEDFQFDIHMDDDRTKTVKIERGQEGQEIMFVRSEQVFLTQDLQVCCTAVRDDLVAAAIAIG